MVHDKAFVNGQHRVNFAQPIERNHEFIVIPHELIRQGLSYISSYELMFYNGDCVPKVAYGTTSSTTSEEVNEAIQAGVRHFVYSAASSPASIQAMATALSTSSLSRDDVTISLTVLTDMKVPLIAQTRALLDALSTDAADLVKLSVTAEAKEITDEEIVIGMWQDMEGLKRAKVAKNLGLANSSIRQLEIILENCSVKPVSLDMVCPSTPIIAELVFCEAHNVRLVATVQELKADELLQSEFKSDSKYTSNRTPSQMTLRCYTTRGMGLILEGDVSQDLKNFSLDFTIPSDNMFYTDVVSGAASNLMTPDDSDHEDNGPRKPLQLMRFQTVRSCESLFSLRYNRSMDSLGVMRSRNSSSDSLAAISRNISREALASISRNMSTDSLADMDLGVLPPLTELE
jgi:diketogulonate reductase-like aldo/keto reductase